MLYGWVYSTILSAFQNSVLSARANGHVKCSRWWLSPYLAIPLSCCRWTHNFEHTDCINGKVDLLSQPFAVNFSLNSFSIEFQLFWTTQRSDFHLPDLLPYTMLEFICCLWKSFNVVPCTWFYVNYVLCHSIFIITDLYTLTMLWLSAIQQYQISYISHDRLCIYEVVYMKFHVARQNLLYKWFWGGLHLSALWHIIPGHGSGNVPSKTSPNKYCHVLYESGDNSKIMRIEAWPYTNSHTTADVRHSQTTIKFKQTCFRRTIK